MKIRKNFPIGVKVLFLWNGKPYTGTVTSIADTVYGIRCDSDIYSTDRELIPRLQREIYIKKSNCLKTAEISPIEYRNAVYDKGTYPDIETAFYHLPKRTIFPVASGELQEYIPIEPDNKLIELENGNVYRYVTIAKGLVTLVNVKDENDKRIPNWCFQKNFKHKTDENENYITELDISKLYEIPKMYIGYDYDTLKDRNFLDLVYDANSNSNKPLVHLFKEAEKDYDYSQLPDETFYDYNLHTK